jgi:hypothetical protein
MVERVREVVPAASDRQLSPAPMVLLLQLVEVDPMWLPAVTALMDRLSSNQLFVAVLL